MRVSIIVPFHRNLPFLERCLEAVTPLPHGWELIIAGDAPVDDCQLLAARFKARLLNLPGPRGPAVARNRAAEVARGEILVFIDADVVASKGAVARAAKIFQHEPDTFAVFGAYDEAPDDPGFISQYKNLAHSFIHQSSATIAQTFWAGFGAVRRREFLSVGGFDERFLRPSVEDIDLGYRLTAAGFRVKLDPSLRACHLKRWTLGSLIVSDIRDRGIPWTQLILRFGRFNSDLNLKSTYRACVVLSYLLLLLVGLAFVDPRFLWPVPVLAASLVLLSPRYYRYFYRRRGLWFVMRVFPVHYLYHLYNGLSFAVGSALYNLNRAGVQLPGALPLEPWRGATGRVISHSAGARNVVGV
jgi:glycosyltransferase involved in cell wall biosynthesis